MLKKIITLSTLVITTSAFAIPVDWHGVFGVDSTRVDQYRKATSNPAISTADGSQATDIHGSNAENASFQTYLLKLQPTFVINDSVTLNGELTTNYGRGGFLGDNSTKQGQSSYTFGNALYLHNTNNGDSLLLNRFYAELFADTATFIVGRYSKHWGLGAIYNSGDKLWDRHYSGHDGFDARLKLGSFYFTPYWSKLSNGSTQVNTDDVSDYGISVLYDNKDKDIALGVHFSKRKAKQYATTYASSTANSTTAIPLGSTNVKLWDVYLSKSFGAFKIGVEVPLASGDMGNVYSTTQRSAFKANAVLLESSLELNKKWTLGLDGGQVSGDNGGEANFEAMYLHPNYQVAHLLFRYNMSNMRNGNSIFDSYITNARYGKLYAQYMTDTWKLKTAFIYATAMESAKAGSVAFNHEKNKKFTATQNQSDDLGYELDFDIEYNWNTNVSLGFQLGYLFTGDYFAFTNTANQQKVENSYLTNFHVAVEF